MFFLLFYPPNPPPPHWTQRLYFITIFFKSPPFFFSRCTVVLSPVALHQPTFLRKMICSPVLQSDWEKGKGRGAYISWEYLYPHFFHSFIPWVSFFLQTQMFLYFSSLSTLLFFRSVLLLLLRIHLQSFAPPLRLHTTLKLLIGILLYKSSFSFYPHLFNKKKLFSSTFFLVQLHTHHDLTQTVIWAWLHFFQIDIRPTLMKTMFLLVLTCSCRI